MSEETREGGSVPRVLIVEDNEHICQLFKTWLSDSYQVEVAYDGDQALEQFDPAIDIMLLDRRMPTMSGDEVLEVVRDRGWDGQVIMVTAVEPSVDLVWMEFDDYLLKPVDKTELIEAVEKQRGIQQMESDIQEYLGLIARRQAVERAPGSVGTHSEIRTNDEYEELVERIETLAARLQPKLTDLTEEEIISIGIRDLWYQDGGAVTQ